MLALLEKPYIYNGYIKGYCQPVGLLCLRVAPVNALQIQHLQLALAYYFPALSPILSSMPSCYETVACFGEYLCALQKMAGLPLFEKVKIDTSHEKPNIFYLWVPMLHGDSLHYLIVFMINLFNQHSAPTSFISNPSLLSQVDKLITKLKVYAPKGRNTLRLLEAAHEEGIPWKHVAQNTFQYGYGINSRWFDSTFTDKTSQLAACLARDKQCTSVLLRKLGMPVPQQQIISNETEAVSIANEIGYPVVIKPHNQDGGKGVFAQLMSDSSVKKAYQKARKYSSIVLLEKHIVGKDYRLVVLNGQLIWAIERIPAGVIGDGLNTIHTLLQKINLQPERGREPLSPLKHINITEDVTDFLAEQGFTMDSVPNSGQFVPLHRIANVSAGGTPVDVFDSVHPDNKRLVETAATLLRLDIAGIDFIASDIRQSYFENGGKIIEINAQPQLGLITPFYIYRNILSTLVSNQGRIPIIVVCGHSRNNHILQRMQIHLSNQYSNIGMAKENCAFMNGKQILRAQSQFDVGNALLLNNKLNALIYCITAWEDIDVQGLPFDRYDMLLFVEEPILNKVSIHQAEMCSINTLLKACHGPCIILETAIDYLIKLKNRHEHKIILALNEPPQKAKSYPSFIETISYLNDENQVVMQSNFDGNLGLSYNKKDILCRDVCETLLMSIMASIADNCDRIHV